MREQILAWQERNLTAEALARVRLQLRSATAAQSKVLVTLPNGKSRQMEAGLSSIITKAVVEVFAHRFLSDPALLWISESGNKVIRRDDQLAQSIGLKIETDRLLPDVILVDIAPEQPLVIFIEVVATAGWITEARKGAFSEMMAAAQFARNQVAFVSAFQDRDAPAFKRALPNCLGNLRLVRQRTRTPNHVRWQRSRPLQTAQRF